MGKSLVIAGTDFSSVAVSKITFSNKVLISAVANSKDKGLVTGSGLYSPGEKVTLTASPKSGYSFLRWSDGVKEPTRSIIVDKYDKVYKAIFATIGAKEYIGDKSIIGSSTGVTALMTDDKLVIQKDLSSDYHFLVLAGFDSRKSYQVTISYYGTSEGICKLGEIKTDSSAVLKLEVSTSPKTETAIIPSGDIESFGFLMADYVDQATLTVTSLQITEV